MASHGAAPWAARAGTVERAVHVRHLRQLWYLPGTRLGRIGWPGGWRQRLFLGSWHYWWQAHLMDCLLDAQLREPLAARRDVVRWLARGIWLRNARRWTNSYHDDIAWLGLALHRAATVAGLDSAAALRQITSQLRAGCTQEGGGGLWWRAGDDFKNAPATGPAAILLARHGDAAGQQHAVDLGEWLSTKLVDAATGLVWDGLRVGPDGSVRAVEKTIYSYCQGVYLGLCVELAAVTGDSSWLRRASGVVSAIDRHLVDEHGVLRCHGDGDGGLFTGILARYLALAVTELPASEASTRQLAARLVLTAADAAWGNRRVASGGPLFGLDWSAPAPPSGGPGDLSVQLSGWMLTEAAALVERRAPPPA
jgi:predicted alpha-1,6-mannanase (GH76 family)